MYIKIAILSFLAIVLIACRSNPETEGTQKKVKEINANEQITFNGIFEGTPVNTLPIIDSTNFDNFSEKRAFLPEEIELLQLKRVYPKMDDEGYSFKIFPSYQLALSDDFKTLVISAFKGDNELESVLINYDKNEKIIAYKVIAYDEIAEGWSRKFSYINNDIITVIDELYLDNKQVDTTIFHINKSGEINQIKTEFISTLKPNQIVILNHLYTDTIVFDAYNNDGDYALLMGKKYGIDLSLIYNRKWDNNEEYQFDKGDRIVIKWRMDSIWLAGDGETLDFKETVVEAKKITSENEPILFLWREDVFDNELNEKVSSIFINQSYCNNISDQEKAALGYVSFNIGNECWWDGKANQDKSNLKCKILASLGLGYQCSDKHLGFLRKWFSGDPAVLKEFESCGTMPYTATIQSTFDEIQISTNETNRTISVSYKAHGINSREARKWSWHQTDKFKYNAENIVLVNSEKTDMVNGK